MTNTALQMILFPPDTEWVPPSELPDLSAAKEIAIDLETRDPQLKTHGPGWARPDSGDVVGVAVATSFWSGYLPVKHLGGGNLDERLVKQWMKKVCALPCDKIMHNAQYDWGWLRRWLGENAKMNGRVICTMMTAGLIDENRFSYSLNALCYDYLNKTKSERTLVAAAKEFGINDHKAELWKLPAPFIAKYAQTDAELALELWTFFKTKLGQDDLWAIWELETGVMPCFLEMTWRGIRIDIDRVERTKQQLITEEKKLHRKIKKMAGGDVEIWAAQSIAKAFEKLKIPFDRTEKGAPSFTRSFLVEHPHELPQLISRAREINKTHSAFLTNILKHIASDGRVHSHINQLRSDDGGTVSGRISMQNPALQTIPARDPWLGPLIRSLFLPEENQQWASVDFCQQEPLMLLHYAKAYGDSRNSPLPLVEDFVALYKEDPSTDFYSKVAELTGLPRKKAKTISLGLIYGMGQLKLSHQLDIDLDEAKELIKQYHEHVPFVRALMQGVTRRLNDATASGSIRTLKGRKCRFELWEPDDFKLHKALPYKEAIAEHGSTCRLKRAFSYKALNRLLQSSSADQVKMSMQLLFEQGVVPLLQVHDELCFSVKNKEEAQKHAKIMETAVELALPSRCDIEIGPSWGETR